MVSSFRFDRRLSLADQSFFLFGPRGTGKSTWFRMVLPNAPRFDLLDESLYQTLLAQPHQLGDRLRTIPKGEWVVIDEAQRLPFLLNEVHRAIEERGQKFVLCGSSARKLKTAGTNLLAGRALQRRMFPFLPSELGAHFDLNQALQFGTLPIVWQATSKQEVLSAYVQTYLREEIQLEALVRNLPGFSKFLPIAALFHGQTVNVSSIARDAGTARTTVAGYLDILEDTLVAYRLPAFESKLRVRERKLPKLYWVDPGIVRTLRRHFHAPTTEELGGLFEGWVLHLLRAYQAYRDRNDELFYWSPLDSASGEVDFLVSRGDRFLAIEVKAATKYHKPMFSGLRALANLPGIHRRLLLYLGEVAGRTEDGIDILPAQDFARQLEEGALWDR